MNDKKWKRFSRQELKIIKKNLHKSRKAILQELNDNGYFRTEESIRWKLIRLKHKIKQDSAIPSSKLELVSRPEYIHTGDFITFMRGAVTELTFLVKEIKKDAHNYYFRAVIKRHSDEALLSRTTRITVPKSVHTRNHQKISMFKLS